MNNSDLQFSCGFFAHSLNFFVQGLKPSSNPKSTLYYSLKNFLERGYPTRPTHYLEKKIQELHPDFSWQRNLAPVSIMLRPHTPNWDDTIKGFDKGGHFPARTFFNNLIDEHLPEYSFIKNLIVPECRFGDILVDPIGAGGRPNWAMDFFLPCADLVIEVDGTSHQGEVERASDGFRDRMLRKYGIKTHRIETHKINKNSSEIRNYFVALKKVLDSNEDIQLIRAFVNNSKYDEVTTNYDLIALARLQRVIIELLSQKTLRGGGKIEIKTDFKSSLNWPMYALDDLKNSYDLLRFHFPKAPKFPEIEVSLVEKFSASNNVTRIDLSIFSHADDRTHSDDIIRIFNTQLDSVYLWDTKDPIKRIKVTTPELHYEEPLLKLKRGLKQNLEKLNSTTFGIDEFRSGQFDIISSALESKTVLGLLPTGGGKSLCFQSLGAIDFGCTIIVCPITALIRDHVLELQQFGFGCRSGSISAEVVTSERDLIFQRLRTGSLKFLFVSPEQFQKPEFRQLLASVHQARVITRFVIDEVHCISEWGHDFRTSYLNLAHTIEKFAPNVPILCLTATAAVKVIQDIQIEFDMSDEDIVYSMDQSRHELNFQVLKSKRKMANLKSLLEQRRSKNIINKKNAFIVFAPTINDSQVKFGVSGVSTHVREVIKDGKIGVFSGKTPKNFVLSEELKNLSETSENITNYDTYKIEVQKQFKKNKLDGIVATKAFGMGVNKPNVRLVVHYGMPQSLESLYQEAGRAGRDKKPSECITIFTPEETVSNEVHSQETTLRRLKTLQQRMSKGGGDLGQQLFFLTNSNKIIEEELNECCQELQFLRTFGSEGFVTINEPESEADKNNLRTKEKIIYRLKQLGFIKDWTVEDFYKGTYIVEWSDQDPHMLGDSITKIITKYSSVGSDALDIKQEIHDAKSHAMEAETQLIRILLDWNYRHFVYQRRESLKNVYNACTGYQNSTEFKKIVESYFQTNKAFSQLPSIINLNAADAIEPVTKILLTNDGKLKTANKLNQMSNNLMKYLEGYRDNPGLNLLSSLLRLADNDFQNSDGRPRFDQFLDAFKKNGADVLLLEPLIDIFCKLEPKLGQQAFKYILERFPKPELAKLVLQTAECKEAEHLLINDLNDRLETLL